MLSDSFGIVYSGRKPTLTTYTCADGKLKQSLIAPTEYENLLVIVRLTFDFDKGILPSLQKNQESAMGFIACPECTQSISDGIDVCPYCGSPPLKNLAPSVTLQPQIDLDSGQPALPPFFAVSLLKLVVLSTFTLGIYNIYWFWRNWNRIRASGEPSIMPIWRAIFLVIFCYPCFYRIRMAGLSRGIAPAPPVGVLAVCYILATISWRLPGALWLMTFLNVIFLLPIQSYVNRINAAESPGHDPNSRFGVWNWIATVVGGFLFILAIIGSFLPSQ